MSPEQVQSVELTNRSDLYSLGAVMYELLTGSRPFRAGNLQKLLHQIVYATAPPIHTLRTDIPEDLENVVAMALQKEPNKRYKSGLDFAAELPRVHATIRALEGVTVLKVSSTLLEQVSASCQLRFNRVFLRTMITRLQASDMDSTTATYPRLAPR